MIFSGTCPGFLLSGDPGETEKRQGNRQFAAFHKKLRQFFQLPQPFSCRTPCLALLIRDHISTFIRVGLLTCASSAHVHSLLGFPMTGFRLVHCLRAYSGGTVPDFHRIIYSPPASCLQNRRRSNDLFTVQIIAPLFILSTARTG